jgi:RNA polymerase sigma-70 factor, ECF subfamily
MMQDPTHESFTRLFVENERGIYGFVFSMLPSPTDADDVVQETMTQLWEHFEAYDPSRPFMPWACRFAYRQVLMHRRRKSVQRKFFSDVIVELLAAEYPTEEDWSEQRRAALRLCMAKLQDKERALIQHRYAEDIALTDLAKQSGRTVNSLYKSLQSIRRRLTECIMFRLESGDAI